MRRLTIALFGLAIAAAPAPSSAGDGAIELSQTCASNTGCAPGDEPGYPITLTARGSYRLTSDLSVPSHDTNGIEIGSDDVSIDFNGFGLIGPGTVPIVGMVCTLPGTGTGILATANGGGFVAHDGRVRGMGQDGINVYAQNARIDRMIVERNCGNGIRIGVAGLVIDSQVRANRGNGIEVAARSRVRDSIADNNYATGILAGAGSVVTTCVASGNGSSGLDFDLANSGAVAIGNSILANGWNTAGGGMDLPTAGIASQNSVANNAGGGINNPNAAGGLALNATANNINEVTGGLRIACNAENGFRACPPTSPP